MPEMMTAEQSAEWGENPYFRESLGCDDAHRRKIEQFVCGISQTN
jgi:hypothetical protein